MTDHWLRHLRGDLNYRRTMETEIIRELGTRLASGEPLCMAVKGGLQRARNHHRYTMDQMKAQGFVVQEGDGWGETERLMEAAWSNVIPQCQQRMVGTAPDKIHSQTLAACIERHTFDAHKVLVVTVINTP